MEEKEARRGFLANPRVFFCLLKAAEKLLVIFISG